MYLVYVIAPFAQRRTDWVYQAAHYARVTIPNMDQMPSSSLLFWIKYSPKTRKGSSGLPEEVIRVRLYTYAQQHINSLLYNQPLHSLQENSGDLFIEIAPCRGSMCGCSEGHRAGLGLAICSIPGRRGCPVRCWCMCR